jgi:hypothetical protein
MGEINVVVDRVDVPHTHFVVSYLLRGGFSGGPVIIVANEGNALIEACPRERSG